jgi:hypothetical protein
MTRWWFALVLVACSDDVGVDVGQGDTQETSTPVTALVACTTDTDGAPFTPARVGIADPGEQPVWFTVADEDGCVRIDRDAGTYDVQAEAVQDTCAWGPEVVEIVDGEVTWLFIDLMAVCMGR